jgi:hypothetical protein
LVHVLFCFFDLSSVRCPSSREAVLARACAASVAWVHAPIDQIKSKEQQRQKKKILNSHWLWKQPEFSDERGLLCKLRTLYATQRTASSLMSLHGAELNGGGKNLTSVCSCSLGNAEAN